MPTTTEPRTTLSGRRRLVAILAGAAIGVSGAVAVASAQSDETIFACPPSEADLLRAAGAARVLEAQRPDLFAASPRPASYDDLRLAAEWARRLDALDPERAACRDR